MNMIIEDNGTDEATAISDDALAVLELVEAAKELEANAAWCCPMVPNGPRAELGAALAKARAVLAKFAGGAK